MPFLTSPCLFVCDDVHTRCIRSSRTPALCGAPKLISGYAPKMSLSVFPTDNLGLTWFGVFSAPPKASPSPLVVSSPKYSMPHLIVFHVISAEVGVDVYYFASISRQNPGLMWIKYTFHLPPATLSTTCNRASTLSDMIHLQASDSEEQVTTLAAPAAPTRLKRKAEVSCSFLGWKYARCLHHTINECVRSDLVSPSHGWL